MSQKHIGSLARPFNIELALRPVASGLEKGAELVREAHFGALRLFGGEVGFQSSRLDAGQVPGGLRVIRGYRDHRSSDLVWAS